MVSFLAFFKTKFKESIVLFCPNTKTIVNNNKKKNVIFLISCHLPKVNVKVISLLNERILKAF